MPTAVLPAFSQSRSDCSADQRSLFPKAIRKITPRVVSEQGGKPEDLRYGRLLLDIIVGQRFHSFSSPEAFLNANRECCSSLHHDFMVFQKFVEPKSFQRALGARIRTDPLVILQFDIRATADVAGINRRFKKQYEVCVG